MTVPVTMVASVADFPLLSHSRFLSSLPLYALPRSFSLLFARALSENQRTRAPCSPRIDVHGTHTLLRVRTYVRRARYSFLACCFPPPFPLTSLPLPIATGRCQFLVGHRLVRDVRIAFHLLSHLFLKPLCDVRSTR